MAALDRPEESGRAMVDNDESSSREVVSIPVGTTLEDACRTLILATLERCGGVRKRAAAMLGISLKTLYNKLVAYRVEEQRQDVCHSDPARGGNGAGRTGEF
jgi:DNA-binding NtrC family response regulator